MLGGWWWAYRIFSNFGINYFVNNLDKDNFALSNGENGLEVIKILESASKQLKEVYANEK